MSTTTFNAWDDIWDMICKEQAKEQDRLRFEEMKVNRQIDSPVLICNRETRRMIEKALPNMFCILATDLCEKDKVYMVTDKAIADNIRQSLNWMNRRGEKE